MTSSYFSNSTWQPFLHGWKMRFYGQLVKLWTTWCFLTSVSQLETLSLQLTRKGYA